MAADPDYIRLSGTSMATAVGSAASIALMLEANRTADPDKPPLTPNAVKAILQYTALRIHNDLGLEYDPLRKGAGRAERRRRDRLAAVGGHDARRSARRGCSRRRCRGRQSAARRCRGIAGVIWGSAVIWGSSTLPINQTAWGNAVIWGSQRQLGNANAVIWGSNLVWTDSQSWGSAVIWGSDAIGTPTATRSSGAAPAA